VVPYIAAEEAEEDKRKGERPRVDFVVVKDNGPWMATYAKWLPASPSGSGMARPLGRMMT
jgi:hypothetical protein